MLATVLPVIVISPAIAPIVGGVLTSWFGWPSTFWFIALLEVIAFAFTWFFLSETPKPLTAAGIPYFFAYVTILRSRKALPFLFMVCISYSTYFAFIFQCAPIYSQMGFSTQEISYLYVPVAVFFYIGSQISKRLASIWSFERTLLTGVVIFLAGTSAMAFVTIAMASSTTLAMISAFCLVLVGNAIVLSVGTAQVMSTFPELRGSSSALVGLLQSLATVLAP